MSNDPNKCNEPHCERTRVWHPLGCLSTKCREHTIKFHQQRMGWAAKGVVHSECIDMLRAGATQWPKYEGDVYVRGDKYGQRTVRSESHHGGLPDFRDGLVEQATTCLDVLTDAVRALCSTHPETPCADPPGVASAAGGGALTGAVEQDTPREPFSARVMRGEVEDPYQQPHPRLNGLTGAQQAWSMERLVTRQRRPHALAAQAALIEEYRPKTCEVLADVQDVDDWGDV